MARVNAREVKEIIEVDEDVVVDLRPFITAGNLLVTETLGGQGMSDALLKEIERNVVAHLICAMDPRAQEEEIDDGRVKYTGKFGEGFKSTPYGQTAMLLDSTGQLASRGKKKASMGVVDYSVTL